MRLAKFLAHAGVASRRQAAEIVRSGRVRLDGTPIEGPEERVVYAVNKPAGVVSTARDTHGRPTVVDLVEDGRRLYPIGRLDAETTGLILLTNDGELANLLAHPSHEVPKTYRARLAGGTPSPAALAALAQGVDLEDGRTASATVALTAPDTIEIEIHEGRKRQVRRMCEAVGHRVLELERIRFGPLELDRLAPGEARRLSDDEIAALRDAARR
jgi:23S rRNA pseudouridine2605 synthase